VDGNLLAKPLEGGQSNSEILRLLRHEGSIPSGVFAER
jgi:hypothetical protein